MNTDRKLLIRKALEAIIKNIRNSAKKSLLKNNNVEIISKNILLDYYNLITENISNQKSTIYLLHIISREINNSSSLVEKELLLTLLPEFYVPFINTDISLTDPYLSRILTSIQSNILSEISPLYVGEIFKRIILSIFNEDNELNRETINKELFEICQGFCLYNMRQAQYNYQLCGVICLNFLLNGIDYSFLNIKNYIEYIWEKINFFLSFKNFTPKEYLLNYLFDFITKFKVPFKPYVNLAIYKILEFLDDKNSNIRKYSLNVLSLLISLYPNEIKPIKSLIIQLLTILQNDKNESIRNKSTSIYNKLQKEFMNLSKSTINNHEIKKNKIYFYDLGSNNDSRNKNFEFKKIDNNRINNKRIVLRKPILPTKLSFRKNSIQKNNDAININLNKQNKSMTIERKKVFNRNRIINLKQNNRYFKENAINANKINKFSDGMRLRDLLNVVKKKSDKKCKLTNNFSNLRDEVKKNNNGLLQIRKIKSEKVIKTF